VSQARAAAASVAPVWLVGEPGAGKETVARVIHHTGPRRERAFLAVECGGLQPYLIDGLLAGKGGLASGPHVGTVLLKNPAALAPDAQRRLLEWALGANGPRLICAAGGPALDGVRARRLLPAFETDCSAMEIVVPPLRDRLDDLPRLAERLLDRLPPPKPTVADDVFPALRAYRWPGNVRELTDVLLAAAAVAGGKIARDHLPRFVRERFLLASDPHPPATAAKLDAVLEEVERRLVMQAMARVNGNLTAAASRLGIPRERLVRRVNVLGLSPPPQRPEKP
jgi:DNA-binding NtrC family response regulator